MISLVGKRAYYFAGVILLALYLPSESHARAAQQNNEIQPRASVDRKSANIGDRIRLSIEIRAVKGIDIASPEFKDRKIGDFEIRDSARAAKRSLFGSKSLVYRYDITAYTIGTLTIPELEFKYRKKSYGEWATAKTQPIGITIKSVLPETQTALDIKDIKGPLGFGRANWPIIILVLAVVLSIAAIIVYIKIRSKPAPQSAYEQAVETMKRINESFATSGNVKGFHVMISDCVRRYIEETFQLKAPEMTTQEFLSSVEGSTALSPSHKGLLREFLNACDMVKFANYAPTRQEIDTVSAAARNFIDETKDFVHVHI